MSFLAAILPYLLTRRKYVKPGPFHMSDKYAYPVLGIASAYIVFSNVIYCFPFTLPVSAQTMVTTPYFPRPLSGQSVDQLANSGLQNYVSLMTGGVTLFLTLWYLWKRNHGYEGPTVLMEASDDVRKGKVLTGAEYERDRKGRHAAAEATSTVPDSA